MKPIADWTKQDWNSLILQLFLASVLFWILKTDGDDVLEGFIDAFTAMSQSAPS